MFLKTFITFFALQSLASIISIILRQYDFYIMSIVLIVLPLAICSLSYPFYPVNIFSESFSVKIIFINITAGLIGVLTSSIVIFFLWKILFLSKEAQSVSNKDGDVLYIILLSTFLIYLLFSSIGYGINYTMKLREARANQQINRTP